MHYEIDTRALILILFCFLAAAAFAEVIARLSNPKHPGNLLDHIIRAKTIVSQRRKWTLILTLINLVVLASIKGWIRWT